MSNKASSKPIETAEMLRELADFFEARDDEYGSSHLRHGKIMAAFFPNGLELLDEDDFYNYHIFDLTIIKMNRIAEAMKESGGRHFDSYIDGSVYLAMGAAMINRRKDK